MLITFKEEEENVFPVVSHPISAFPLFPIGISKAKENALSLTIEGRESLIR
jgi:hypothetical protein